MNPPLHSQHGHTVNLPDHQPPSVALCGGAHETRYFFVRNADSLFEVIGETSQPTAEHNRDARLNADTRSDNPGRVFGAFVKTCACHSLNHFQTLATSLFDMEYLEHAVAGTIQ